MSPARSTPSEPSWNEVKALFENLRKEIGVLAEEVRGLRPEIAALKTAIHGLTEEVAMLKTALRSLDQRVTTLEARAS